MVELASEAVKLSTPLVQQFNHYSTPRARAQLNAKKPPAKVGQTQSEIQAEAQIAASRGELDKVCDWL